MVGHFIPQNPLIASFQQRVEGGGLTLYSTFVFSFGGLNCCMVESESEGAEV
jgi:hypothetical protein